MHHYIDKAITFSIYSNNQATNLCRCVVIMQLWSPRHYCDIHNCREHMFLEKKSMVCFIRGCKSMTWKGQCLSLISLLCLPSSGMRSIISYISHFKVSSKPHIDYRIWPNCFSRLATFKNNRSKSHKNSLKYPKAHVHECLVLSCFSLVLIYYSHITWHILYVRGPLN